MKKTMSKSQYICNKNNFCIGFSYYYQKGLCHLEIRRAEVMPVSYITSVKILFSTLEFLCHVQSAETYSDVNK